MKPAYFLAIEVVLELLIGKWKEAKEETFHAPTLQFENP
jgi:hypothetical protein